jgi:hypothetical protein
VPFDDKCHLTHKRLNMPQVKQYKLSMKSILHFVCQMALKSRTSPSTFTAVDTVALDNYVDLIQIHRASMDSLVEL